MSYINMPPYAPILMESTRAIGYSLEAAIADIIDNSITAHAATVKLFFFPIDKEYVAILDDGTGMDYTKINTAMQYGSQNPKDKRAGDDLGRFGLGLKTASLSQCKTLTVVSKQKDQIECRQWDLDYVAQSEEWRLKILEDDELLMLPEINKLLEYENGTLIIWQNLDRMKLSAGNLEKTMGRYMDDARMHLSLVYHRYLRGERGIRKLDIYFNNVKIAPMDPFLEEKSTRAMDDEILNIHGREVVVRPYILPHISKMTAEELEALSGKEGLRRRQGFYVYRNKRLLVWGTWFRMRRQDDSSKLVRIRVDIPNDLDDLWTLDIKKSSAAPPIEVKNNLSMVIEKMAEKSKRTWTVRGKKEINDEVVHMWNRLDNREGGIIYEINQDHPLVSELFTLLPQVKRDVQRLLRYIEKGLPLNALYIDLINDGKIDNDQGIEEKEVISMVRQILDNTELAQWPEMVKMLKLSEPFCFYIDAIDRKWPEGKIHGY